VDFILVTLFRFGIDFQATIPVGLHSATQWTQELRKFKGFFHTLLVEARKHTHEISCHGMATHKKTTSV
jgi:hypothetical protein